MRELIITLFIVCSNLAAQNTVGLIRNDPASFQGYTLMSNNEWSYLINNNGQLVNSWESAYKASHGVYLLPDGNLLRAGAISSSFNAGGSGGVLELFSWEGDLLWQYELSSATIQQHHDLAPLPNGNFLCTLWERRSQEEAQSEGRAFLGEVWSEKIVEIKIQPDNEADVVWEWNVWDHLIQDVDPNKNNFGIVADQPGLIDLNYIGEGENTFGNWMHINAIHYQAELDQIAISSRNFSEVYIIDHSTTTEEASSHSGGRYGKGGDILYRFGNPQVYRSGEAEDQLFFRQHDVRWLEDAASFMVFNNNYIPGQQSEVLQFRNPAVDGFYEYSEEAGYGNDEIIRSFSQSGFYSDILSGADQLPNGNWLITYGRTGHLIEITPENEIVWEYIYPVNRNGGPAVAGGEARLNQLFRAKRYAPDYPAFDNRPLLPQGTIEIRPEAEPAFIRLINTLAEETLFIDNQLVNLVAPELTLFTINGQLVYQSELAAGLNRVEVAALREGMYIAVVRQGEREMLLERWLKM